MHQVEIPGQLVLVLGRNVRDTTERKRASHPCVPASPRQWHIDLNTATGGVAATYRKGKGGRNGDSLALHLGSYLIGIYPRSPAQGRATPDSYNLGYVNPLRLRDHDLLSESAVVIKPQRWLLVSDAREIPHGSESFWVVIKNEFDKAGSTTGPASPQATPVTSDHTRYLDRLDDVIDATERITVAEASLNVFPFRRVGSAGERRRGAQAVYIFHIAGDRVPELKTHIRVREQQQLGGRVTVVDGRAVTVAFDTRVDYDALPKQGTLEESSNSVVFDTQRDAVGKLRSDESINRHLLRVLVDGDARPLEPVSATPRDPLDESQHEAMVKAFAVEDLLLIQGPPGTGKTRTISQIAWLAARAQQRVLVTSHTNRAVDNVLERLPQDLLVIRVGNESSVTAEGKPYLLESQINELRQQVANGVESAQSVYRRLEDLPPWRDQFDIELGRLRECMQAERLAVGDYERAQEQYAGPARDRVDARQRDLEDLANRLDDVHQESSLRADHLRRAQSKAKWPIVGVFFQPSVQRLEGEVALAHKQKDVIVEERGVARSRLIDALEDLKEEVAGDPEVVAARHRLREKSDRAANIRTKLCETEAAINSILAPLVSRLELSPSDGDPDASLKRFVAFQEWLAGLQPVLGARMRLIGKWKEAVDNAGDDLHPEFIRYADVIAATAIGSGSRSELSSVDFDLAIVDEAGQIGVPNVIVPLVRARRGVLVGDHMQLPPFLDSDVEKWGSDIKDSKVQDLLSKSAFETLAGSTLPTSNVVRLRTQRRMPPSIAKFISRSFYDGWLLSDSSEGVTDQLFDRSLVMVDTSPVDESTRREEGGRGTERWGTTGYRNVLEADLLVRLAAFYHQQHGGDAWAIIVPYRAQIELITARLARLVGDSVLTDLNVGTVDSFQGGERPVIMYGFTRSNRNGNIGFLRELRRANVAFSRAKQRLILVGDLSTLSNARDEPFRYLIRSMHQHVSDVGELIVHDEAVRRLDRLT